MIISEIVKTNVEIIKIVVEEFKHKPYIDMRVWVLNDPSDPGSEVATKKGLCVSADLVPEFIEGLQKALESLQNSGG